MVGWESFASWRKLPSAAMTKYKSCSRAVALSPSSKSQVQSFGFRSSFARDNTVRERVSAPGVRCHAPRTSSVASFPVIVGMISCRTTWSLMERRASAASSRRP